MVCRTSTWVKGPSKPKHHSVVQPDKCNDDRTTIPLLILQTVPNKRLNKAKDAVVGAKEGKEEEEEEEEEEGSGTMA